MERVPGNQPGNRWQARRGVSARARRRRRRAILFYCVSFLVVIAAAVILSLTVLFRIDTIQVENTSRYSQEEILEICGIEIGDNLFLADVNGAQEELDRKLPYAGNVRVERKLPATLQITVEEPVLSAAFEQDDSYILVSQENKILEIAQAAPAGCLVVSGLELENPRAGYPAVPKEEEVQQVFNSLTQALSDCAFSGITQIDVSNLYQMMVVYDGRIRILLGNSNDLDLKLVSAKKIVEEELEETEKGELDVSLTRDLKKAYYNADSSSSDSSASSSQPEDSGEPASSASSETASASSAASGSSEAASASSQESGTSPSASSQEEGSQASSSQPAESSVSQASSSQPQEGGE